MKILSIYTLSLQISIKFSENQILFSIFITTGDGVHFTYRLSMGTKRYIIQCRLRKKWLISKKKPPFVPVINTFLKKVLLEDFKSMKKIYK